MRSKEISGVRGYRKLVLPVFAEKLVLLAVEQLVVLMVAEKLALLAVPPSSRQQ